MIEVECEIEMLMWKAEIDELMERMKAETVKTLYPPQCNQMAT